MKTKLRVDRFTPKDISDTPEGFEKRYDKRKPQERERSPLEEPSRPNLTKLLERFGIQDDHS